MSTMLPTEVPLGLSPFPWEISNVSQPWPPEEQVGKAYLRLKNARIPPELEKSTCAPKHC